MSKLFLTSHMYELLIVFFLFVSDCTYLTEKNKNKFHILMFFHSCSDNRLRFVTKSCIMALRISIQKQWFVQTEERSRNPEEKLHRVPVQALSRISRSYFCFYIRVPLEGDTHLHKISSTTSINQKISFLIKSLHLRSFVEKIK